SVYSTTAPALVDSYALSLHDALPIWLYGTPTIRTSGVSWTPCTRATVSRTWAMRRSRSAALASPWLMMKLACFSDTEAPPMRKRSEEHTSELQSRGHLVCRLLLEKKK